MCDLIFLGFPQKYVFISNLRAVQQSISTALERDLSAEFSSTMSLLALDRAVVLKECEPG